MAGLAEANAAARLQIEPDAAGLLGLDAVNKFFRGFEFACLLIDLGDFLHPRLFIAEVLVGIDSAVGGVRNGPCTEQAKPVVLVLGLRKPSRILHASNVVVVHLVARLGHQSVIWIDAVAVAAAERLEVKIPAEQVVDAGEVFATVVPRIHPRHQAHAVVDFVPQRGQDAGPEMLVVRVFDDAAAAATHNRIVPHHNGIAELM